MARKHDYPIIRFLIGLLHTAAVGGLVVGLASGAYLWLRAEALRDGLIPGGPFASLLNPYDSAQLCLAAAASASCGLLAFIVLGAMAQILCIQRDQAMNTTLQVQLLEDILELNEELATASSGTRVELCDGCGRLGSLHRIDSGQWVCRNCRRQMRSA